MIIYISSPYTLGDISQNIRRACSVGDEILRKGHIPLIPHLSHLWHLISPKSYDEWLRIDSELMDICDAVIRLPGESKGADLEIKRAKENCQAIYYSLKDIPERKVTSLIRADVADNLGQLISIQYEEIGSIEGTLEMISIHRTLRTTLYHSITHRSVSCEFTPNLLDDAKAGLGRRVIVYGIVYFNHVHEPVKVQADRIEVMPEEKNLPTAKDLRGMVPDFTGEMKTEDYIRSLRE